MDLGLNGHTALVTGASKGIGLAIATRLSQEGAAVVLCARGADELAQAAAQIKSAGGSALAVVCDVSDRSSAEKVLAKVAAAQFGSVDILVNNVGLATSAKLLASTDEQWDAGLDLNFLSAVRFTRQFLPQMVEQRWGRIINVSSISAKLPNPNHLIYGAAKAAMIHFTKVVADSFAADGVRCNCVLPGITRTELVEANTLAAAIATGRTPEAVMARTLARSPIPAGRIGEPAEIADAVCFLASANADWITGVTLPVDGGAIPTVG